LSSSDRSDALDLEHDLPTTTQDVAALRRAKASRLLNLAEYIRFLERLAPQGSRSVERTRRGPHGDHPFELSD
jgi:hypothetical protein